MGVTLCYIARVSQMSPRDCFAPKTRLKPLASDRLLTNTHSQIIPPYDN